MKNHFYKQQTLICLLLFVVAPLFGQKKYDGKTNKAKVTIEGNPLIGYSTYFDFEEKEVIKGWWDYSRKFGTPLNMKRYYKVTVPASVTDGNIDLVIYSKSETEDQKVQFFLGLKEEKFDRQVKALLLDFKKNFYIDYLVEQMEAQEQMAKKLSDVYNDTEDAAEKTQLLDNIMEKKAAIEALKEEVRRVEKQ